MRDANIAKRYLAKQYLANYQITLVLTVPVFQAQ